MMDSEDKPRKTLRVLDDGTRGAEYDKLMAYLEENGYDVQLVTNDEIIIHDEYSHFDERMISQVMGRMKHDRVQPMVIDLSKTVVPVRERRIPRNLGIIGHVDYANGLQMNREEYNVTANKSQGYFPTEEPLEYRMKNNRSLTTIAHAALMMAALGDMPSIGSGSGTRTVSRNTSKPRPSKKVLAKRKAVKKARKEQRRS